MNSLQKGFFFFAFLHNLIAASVCLAQLAVVVLSLTSVVHGQKSLLILVAVGALICLYY